MNDQCGSTHGEVRCELGPLHLCAHKARVRPNGWLRWDSEGSWEDFDLSDDLAAPEPTQGEQ